MNSDKFNVVVVENAGSLKVGDVYEVVDYLMNKNKEVDNV